MEGDEKMYLVSLYFDEKTNKIIQSYIDKVAEKTGNTFMIDGKVPPHITISAFETKQEEQVIEYLNGFVEKMESKPLQWVSVGSFLPYVIYIAPVLNEYLHGFVETIYDAVKSVPETKMSPYYKPFGWLPHTTIGKKLSKEEMQIAFDMMQSQFQVFSGNVVRVGLAKTNPYQEIKNWELNKT